MFCKINLAEHNFCSHVFVNWLLESDVQFITSFFCLRRRIEVELTGLLFLFTCRPTKSSNVSRSGVNVRAHLLRKNYSRNFSSIRSTP